jgi:hypothetical protein
LNPDGTLSRAGLSQLRRDYPNLPAPSTSRAAASTGASSAAGIASPAAVVAALVDSDASMSSVLSTTAAAAAAGHSVSLSSQGRTLNKLAHQAATDGARARRQRDLQSWREHARAKAHAQLLLQALGPGAHYGGAPAQAVLWAHAVDRLRSGVGAATDADTPIDVSARFGLPPASGTDAASAGAGVHVTAYSSSSISSAAAAVAAAAAGPSASGPGGATERVMRMLNASALPPPLDAATAPAAAASRGPPFGPVPAPVKPPAAGATAALSTTSAAMLAAAAPAASASEAGASSATGAVLLGLTLPRPAPSLAPDAPRLVPPPPPAQQQPHRPPPGPGAVTGSLGGEYGFSFDVVAPDAPFSSYRMPSGLGPGSSAGAGANVHPHPHPTHTGAGATASGDSSGNASVFGSGSQSPWGGASPGFDDPNPSTYPAGNPYPPALPDSVLEFPAASPAAAAAAAGQMGADGYALARTKDSRARALAADTALVTAVAPKVFSALLAHHAAAAAAAAAAGPAGGAAAGGAAAGVGAVAGSANVLGGASVAAAATSAAAARRTAAAAKANAAAAAAASAAAAAALSASGPAAIGPPPPPPRLLPDSALPWLSRAAAVGSAAAAATAATAAALATITGAGTGTRWDGSPAGSVAAAMHGVQPGAAPLPLAWPTMIAAADANAGAADAATAGASANAAAPATAVPSWSAPSMSSQLADAAARAPAGSVVEAVEVTLHSPLRSIASVDMARALLCRHPAVADVLAVTADADAGAAASVAADAVAAAPDSGYMVQSAPAGPVKGRSRARRLTVLLAWLPDRAPAAAAAAAASAGAGAGGSVAGQLGALLARECNTGGDTTAVATGIARALGLFAPPAGAVARASAGAIGGSSMPAATTSKLGPGSNIADNASAQLFNPFALGGAAPANTAADVSSDAAAYLTLARAVFRGAVVAPSTLARARAVAARARALAFSASARAHAVARARGNLFARTTGASPAVASAANSSSTAAPGPDALPAAPLLQSTGAGAVASCPFTGPRRSRGRFSAPGTSGAPGHSDAVGLRTRLSETGAAVPVVGAAAATLGSSTVRPQQVELGGIARTVAPGLAATALRGPQQPYQLQPSQPQLHTGGSGGGSRALPATLNPADPPAARRLYVPPSGAYPLSGRAAVSDAPLPPFLRAAPPALLADGYRHVRVPAAAAPSTLAQESTDEASFAPAKGRAPPLNAAPHQPHLRWRVTLSLERASAAAVAAAPPAPNNTGLGGAHKGPVFHY